MFGLFNRRDDQSVFRIYSQIVAQSRQPYFYKTLSVPDTVDGRYDMIVLHLILLFHRFQSEDKQVKDFGQQIFDLFFKDMDRNLREMGVSDTSVPKKVKKMIEAFYGRASVYRPSIEQRDSQMLAAALVRNIYPETDKDLNGQALADYAFSCVDVLEGQAAQHIVNGDISWPETA
ncbi:MAG: ubiquinol-cytochrome C chaperone family protein [Stappiaceae bacterium]